MPPTDTQLAAERIPDDIAPSETSATQARAIVVAWSIGLIPVVMLLTTWNENLSIVQRASRFFFIPVIVLELSVILFWVRDGIKIPRPPGFILAGLFTLVTIAWSGAIGSGSDYSILQTSVWMVHLIFGLAIAQLATRDPALRVHLVPAMLWGFIAFSALFILFVAIRYEEGHNWVNDIPAYANIRWFAFYAEAIFGLCAWGWIRGRKLLLLVAMLALAMPLWTGSRASLVAVTGGYLAACIFFPFARKGWKLFGLAVIGGVLLAMLATWLAPLGMQGAHRLYNDVGDSGRMELWRIALHAIAERPWFGWGDGQFGMLSKPISINHPHNVILQVLVAWGVVGGALVAMLAGWIALRVYRIAAEDDAPFLIAATILAAASLVDGTLYLVQSTSLFFLCGAILVAAAQEAGRKGPGKV